MKHRNFATAVLVVLAITLAGTIWETAVVRVFANRAGQLEGMIADPRPYDYVNYDYTPNGHHYEFWAFKVPVVITAGLLFVVGVAATVALMRARLRVRALALWGIILMCSVIFIAITAYYYVIAVNVFI